MIALARRQVALARCWFNPAHAQQLRAATRTVEGSGVGLSRIGHFEVDALESIPVRRAKWSVRRVRGVPRRERCSFGAPTFAPLVCGRRVLRENAQGGRGRCRGGSDRCNASETSTSKTTTTTMRRRHLINAHYVTRNTSRGPTEDGYKSMALIVISVLSLIWPSLGESTSILFWPNSIHHSKHSNSDIEHSVSASGRGSARSTWREIGEKSFHSSREPSREQYPQIERPTRPTI